MGSILRTVVKLSRSVVSELEGLNLQLRDRDEGTDVVGFGKTDALD